MNLFEFIVVIVLIGAIGKVLQARYHAGGAAPPPRDDAGEAARARDEVRRLKERIQVLERVITDGRAGDDLDRQIEQLRDDRRMP